MDKTITKIAMDRLGIETLETSNNDILDFHEVSVWALKEMLEAAYKAGQASGK